MTTVLAILVFVAVVGQYVLIKWLLAKRERQLLAMARARLLEDAADRQLVSFRTHTAKLGENHKGLGDE